MKPLPPIIAAANDPISAATVPTVEVGSCIVGISYCSPRLASPDSQYSGSTSIISLPNTLPKVIPIACSFFLLNSGKSLPVDNSAARVPISNTPPATDSAIFPTIRLGSCGKIVIGSDFNLSVKPTK